MLEADFLGPGRKTFPWRRDDVALQAVPYGVELEPSAPRAVEHIPVGAPRHRLEDGAQLGADGQCAILVVLRSSPFGDLRGARDGVKSDLAEHLNIPYCESHIEIVGRCCPDHPSPKPVIAFGGSII